MAFGRTALPDRADDSNFFLGYGALENEIRDEAALRSE
jgi:hypothetical protein